MEELITNKDLVKTDGFIVRSLPGYKNIAIHLPNCIDLSIEFKINIRSNNEVSKRKHQFYHVETLEEISTKFTWWKQSSPYCRTCNPQRGINDQT